MKLLLYSMTLHTVVSVLWIGRVVFDAVLFALPAQTLAADARVRLSRRWLAVTWLLIVAVVITGVWNTVYNPISLGQKGPADTYAAWKDLRRTGYGFALFIKHIGVVGTIVLTAVMDFYAGPKILAGAPRVQAWLPALTRLNLACVLVVLVAVTYMIFTLH